MTTTATISCKIENGALVTAPIYENHTRGKNWLAAISSEPAAPGGLNRDFATRAGGDYLYLVPADLTPGTPVEFGADYYSGRGKKHAARWHGFVVSVSDTELALCECDSAREAIAAGAAYAAESAAPVIDRAALIAERDALLDRLTEIDIALGDDAPVAPKPVITDRRSIMARAWEIARNGATQFGGKAREYFSAALTQAWAEARASEK